MLELQPLLTELKTEFPDFKIINKTESFLMKMISMLLWCIGNKEFMTGYITTLGNTVYVPEQWDKSKDSHKAAVLRHERMHMRQSKKYGRLLYSFLYLFFPLPLGLAWFRAKFEKEGYKESMRAAYWLGGAYALTNQTYKNFILKQFLTGAYGWMWPFRKSMEDWYDTTVAEILIEEGGPKK